MPTIATLAAAVSTDGGVVVSSDDGFVVLIAFVGFALGAFVVSLVRHTAAPLFGVPRGASAIEPRA